VSANECRFSHLPVVWTTVGGNIANVKYAIIFWDNQHDRLLCVSQLSSAQFSIPSGSTLNIGASPFTFKLA
jgi:hypothetical protein